MVLKVTLDLKKSFFMEKSDFYSISRKFYSIGITAQKYSLVNLLFLQLLKISCFIAKDILLFSKNMIFFYFTKKYTEFLHKKSGVKKEELTQTRDSLVSNYI